VKILIIGGTGLISNALTRQLVETGHSVTHFNRGKAESLGARPPTIVGNRRNFADFAAKVRSAGPWDAVVDMICYAADEARSDIDTFRGFTGHLIVCSTIDVYAKPASSYPIREDEPHAPLNDYARQKSEVEQIVLRATSSGMPVTVIRPAHTYGPGSFHKGHFVHCFGGRSTVPDRIRKGKPVIVQGDGSSFWTSCHAEDVARAFVGALGNTASFGKAYHATAEEWLTWNKYFQLLAEALQAPAPELVHIPTQVLSRALPKRATLLRTNLQFNNIFDNSAAKKDLGFRSTIPFADGARATAHWVDGHGGFEDCANEPWYDEFLQRWNKAGEALGPMPDLDS
jgi:nucleoside-diphosphate-sugar epimerase